MQDSEIARIVARIKIVPVFTCSVCSKRQKGDTLTIDADTEDLQGVYTKVRDTRLISHYMPVGWSSYHFDIFKCPKCKDVQTPTR